MFRTGSPYSPFFTSGLLSEPFSSRSVHSLGPRRGSLPTDTPPTRTSPQAVSAEESAAFYFTMQPKRDQSEFLSFLSLDLAESQSLRSASLRRKASGYTSKPDKPFTSKCPYVLCLVPCSLVDFGLPFSRIPEVSQSLAPSSLRLRSSRDSLRALPSPKPAPLSTLPDVPKQPSPSPSVSSLPPRLPSINVTSSLKMSSSCPASQSTPALAVSRTAAPSDIRASVLTHATVSTVSTRARKTNRSDALARLEGRSRPINQPAPKRVARNFMSMSDDEDDYDDSITLDFGDEKLVTLSITLEPEDILLSFPKVIPAPNSAPAGGRFSASSSMSRWRKQPGGKDWFPLKSFIDLQNDDEMSSWNWRSFIEVSSVS